MVNNDFLTIAQEVVDEDIEVMKELIKEEIQPLINYRQKREQEIANKAIADMYKAEEEAR